MRILLFNSSYSIERTFPLPSPAVALWDTSTHTYTHQKCRVSLTLPMWDEVSIREVPGPAVWTTVPSLPFLGVPAFPIAYPLGTVKTSSSTPSTTDQEPQLHSCSLLFKNRLRYQPGQLRDLDASWGLRNVSALPSSFISV